MSEEIKKEWTPVVKKDRKGLTAYQRGVNRLKKKEVAIAKKK